jgi:two-component sensor histidine kinase
LIAPLNFENKPATLSLVLAVIVSSETPLVLLDGSLTIIAASLSFCRAFEINQAQVSGKRISTLGKGEWDTPQLVALLEATAYGLAEVKAYEFHLASDGQKPRVLILNAHRLDYDDKEQTRVLLAVADVTDARANDKLKDELLREKVVLLQEVQHRVANSLQIIASILMQSARRVQSDETRGHLRDAHGRLMSIAAVQRQLATSTRGEVELRPYFTQLCNSLGASMIYDQKLLSIEVVVDDSTINAELSMSLGLIVTELVINALKHAFPGQRGGIIIVTYKADGQNWTLSVTDNGVGMPTDSAPAKPGLGTNIVEALAKRLDAEVQVTSANPGTSIKIVHSLVAIAPIGRAA